MNKKEITSYLDELFNDPKCELEYTKDYELLLSVMLSAQTTDKSVNKATKELYKSCSRICFGCNNPLCRNHDCPLSYERRKRNGKPDGTSIKKTDCMHFALWPYCVLETFFKKICY